MPFPQGLPIYDLVCLHSTPDLGKEGREAFLFYRSCSSNVSQLGNDRDGIRARPPDSKLYPISTTSCYPGKREGSRNSSNFPFPVKMSNGICEFDLPVEQWFSTLLAHKIIWELLNNTFAGTPPQAN